MQAELSLSFLLSGETSVGYCVTVVIRHDHHGMAVDMEGNWSAM